MAAACPCTSPAMLSMILSMPAISPDAYSVETRVSCASLSPSTTSRMERSMSSAVFFADWADCPAKFRTSSATTAKPLPAVPARAASIAAFSARILVCCAISWMVSAIPLIWFELSLIRSIDASSRSIFSCPSPAPAAVFATLSEACLILSVMWLTSSDTVAIDAESSWTEAACSVAPEARDWAASEIWAAPELTMSADVLMLDKACAVPKYACCKDS
ncbi:hypothetical protein SDC9_171930 [bioreactor metagenome]|uniref:Uncharacterized protein n=1 Tax=bioreactor metagenome TaxID=1076179 RepID=A0A645GC86_9ZZZZ